MVNNLGEFVAQAREEEQDDEELQLEDLAAIQQRYSHGVLLAVGGMKEIYRVNDFMTGRSVAKAVMKNLKNKKSVGQFIQEARITARLEHPNIMPVYDIGIDEKKRAFFTMKLVEGDNLGIIFERLKKNDKEYTQQYSLVKLLEIFNKICDAVDYAHSKGVLHLDLKPENIQVGDFGEVLVCDWGLARFNPEIIQEPEPPMQYREGLLTLHGQAFGSPGYMSPEQITKDRKELDHYSDIYSLGCLLYTILTGHSPFTCESLDELLERTAIGDFQAPSKRFPDKLIPNALEAVCLHAMAYECQGRYSSVKELKSEILAYLRGFATAAEKASFITKFTLFCRRHQGLVIFFMALVLISGIFTYVYRNQKKDNAEIHEQLSIKEQEEQITEGRLKAKELENKSLIDLRNEIFQYGINYIIAFDHIKKRQFFRAAKFFKKVDEEKFQPYIKVCYLLVQSLSKPRLNENHLVVLIDLLNQDSQTLVMEMLLRKESNFLTFEQKKALANRLLTLLNPECRNLALDIRTELGQTRIKLSGDKTLTNISPLALFKANDLDLSDTGVAEITVLRDMPLTELDLSNTEVANIEALEDGKLESLDLSYTQVTDILPLKGVPLKSLKIAGLELANPESLREIKTLKEFILPENSDRATLPEKSSEPQPENN